MLKNRILSLGLVFAMTSALGATSIAVAIPAEAKVTVSKASVEANHPITVKVTNSKSKKVVTVLWGDGSVSKKKNKCTAKQVRQKLTRCNMKFTHTYTQTGTFAVKVKQGKKVLKKKSVTVRAGHSYQGKHNHGKSWKAPKGFKQPKGWAVFNRGATFKPCSTVKWHYDSKGEPENSSLMIQTIRESFDLISERTGLKFVEKKKKLKRKSGINLDWKYDKGRGGLALGGGYGYNSGDGHVSFNPTKPEYYADTQAGHDVLLDYFGNPKSTKANGWTVVHEVLHALGFGHVDDPSSVMNPTGAAEFSEGDLAGMREMYLNNPC